MVTETLLVNSESTSSQLYTIQNGGGSSSCNGSAACNASGSGVNNSDGGGGALNNNQNNNSKNTKMSSAAEAEQPVNPKLEFLATCRVVSKVLASMQMIFFLLCMSVRFLNDDVRYTYICSKSDIRLVEGTGLISLILGMILFAGAHWEKTLCLVVWLIAIGIGLVALLFRMCLGLVIGGLTTFYVILIIFTLGMLAISLRIVFLYRKDLLSLENETNPKVTFVAYSRTNNI